MGIAYGGFIYDSISAKRQLKQNAYTVIRDRTTGMPIVNEKVWVDVETDPTGAWFCVFIAYPRIRSPYVFDRYGSTPPHPTIDTDMNKLSDLDIRAILNNGFKETRTQWYHTSAIYGTVWASGSLNDRGTQYNLFENPNLWSSNGASSGARFKRKWGGNINYTDWITSGNDGCSGAVGGWSNYYGASCVQSWFAGCEGGPAINHNCGTGQDRANKLIVWAR
jgi:hypothetical protein